MTSSSSTSMQCIGGDLAVLLTAVLDPDNVRRMAAEVELDRLSFDPGFWEQLCTFCTTQEGTASRYQLVALTVLKQKLPLRSPPSLVCVSVVQAMCHYLSQPTTTATTQNVVNQTCAVIGKCIAILEERCDARHATGGGPSSTPPPVELFSAASGAVLTQVQAALQLSEETPVPAVIQYRHLTLLSEVLQAATARSVVWCDVAQLAPLLVHIVVSAYEFCGASAAAASSLADEASEAVVRLKCGVAAVGLLQDLLFRCLTATGGRANHDDDGTAEMADHMARAWTENSAVLHRIAFSPCTTLPPLTGTSPPRCPSLPHPLCLSLSCSTLTLLTDGLASRSWYKRVTNKAATAELCCTALASLQADVPLYSVTLSSCGGGDGDVEDEEAVAESIRLFHGHCVKRWWCLSLVTAHTPVRAALQRRLGTTHDVLTQLWVLLFVYCPLPDFALSSWEVDVNAFLRDEEACEDGLGTAPRDAAVAALRHLSAVFGPGFVVLCLENANGLLFNPTNESATAAAFATAVPSAAALFAALPPWKLREAALFSIEFAFRHCEGEVARCGPVDLLPLIQQVVATDTVGSAHPVQVARALSCVGVLLPSTASAEAAAGEVVARATQCIADCGTGTGTFVQLAACKLLMGLLPSPFSKRSAPTASTVSLAVSSFANGHRALLRLLACRADMLSGESLYVVLDLLTRWVASVVVVGPGVTAPSPPPPPPLDVEPQLPQVVFDTWRAHIQDPNLSDNIVSLIRLVVRCSACDAALAAQLSWLDAVVRGQCSLAEQCVLPSVVRVLSRIFYDGSPWLADATASQVLSDLCELLLRSEESAILEAASNCLAALLKRCPQAEQVSVLVPTPLVQAVLPGAAPCGGTTTTAASTDSRSAFLLSTVLVAVALHLVRDGRSEVALFGVGPALRAIALAAPQCAESEVRAFLLACARRLTDARTETVATQLLVPLAILSVRYPDAVYGTLAHDALLEPTLSAWITHAAALPRRRDLCLSSEALLALLHAAEQQDRTTACSVRKAVLFQEHSEWRGARAATTTTGEAGEARVPLALAVFVALGRAIVCLSALGDGDVSDINSNPDDNDVDAGTALFQDSDDGEEDGEFIDDDDEWADEGNEVGGTASSGQRTTNTKPAPQVDPALVSARQAEVARVFSAMGPLLPLYGTAATPFFTPDELATIQSFFGWLQSRGGGSSA